jgi:hypothetical protein
MGNLSKMHQKQLFNTVPIDLADPNMLLVIYEEV